MELGQDRIVSEIISRLKTAKPEDGPVEVEGTWGSFARLLAAYISKELGRPILYICPHIDDADKASDDLHTFEGERIEGLPAWEGEEDLADATDEIRAERLKLVARVSSLVARESTHRARFIMPASIQALCQPIPKPKALEESSLGLQIEREVSPEEVVGWLVDNGFERVERVDLPGQFARRGGIVDIYAPLISEKTRLPRSCAARNDDGAGAVRVEFFGDTVESIREINLDTQRSSRQIESIGIVSAVCGTRKREGAFCKYPAGKYHNNS